MSKSGLVNSINSASYGEDGVRHHSGLYTLPNSTDFDYVVADLNVPMAGLDRSVAVSHDSLDNYNGEVEDTPLEDLSQDGVFEVEIRPEENFRIMENISYHVPLLVPDHVMECLPVGLEKQFDSTGYYPEAEEIHDGIFDFLNEYAEPLPVRDDMGLEKYTKRGLESKHPGITEDDFIVAACKDLQGDGIVMTYDADYLSYDVEAAAPKAIERILESE